MKEVGPARFIANHYDNFFHPLSEGLALVPGYALDYGQRMYVPPDVRR